MTRVTDLLARTAALCDDLKGARDDAETAGPGVGGAVGMAWYYSEQVKVELQRAAALEARSRA